jgi:hypothetical protein
MGEVSAGDVGLAKASVLTFPSPSMGEVSAGDVGLAKAIVSTFPSPFMGEIHSGAATEGEEENVKLWGSPVNCANN